MPAARDAAAAVAVAAAVVLQALTLCDKSGIPRHAYLAFVDSFFACKPIQARAQCV
jgi:hypothetical protein